MKDPASSCGESFRPYEKRNTFIRSLTPKQASGNPLAMGNIRAFGPIYYKIAFLSLTMEIVYFMFARCTRAQSRAMRGLCLCNTNILLYIEGVEVEIVFPIDDFLRKPLTIPRLVRSHEEC
jgi:hypothetical protein